MKALTSAFSLQPSALANWLPDMDLNHDKQIQSLLCYRYTIGQAGAFDRLKGFPGQSSRQRGTVILPVSNLLILNQRQAGSLSHN